ncbi:MAG: hypothetical protein KatS3mg029_0706 [Saprospiraceae bacterium]|nr:MAG: hypothetical protein KatS3mg029_0706 [Saprospiraceae bacterium]
MRALLSVSFQPAENVEKIIDARTPEAGFPCAFFVPLWPL